MVYDILFAVGGIGLIALGLSIMKLDKLIISWAAEVLHLTKVINGVDRRRFDDAHRLDEAFRRIQALEERLEGQEAFTSNLEDRLEAHAAELTEHHNKIDTLEINGGVYESLFEQQGLWGEDS